MYEIWSLGHKPFEDFDGKQVASKLCNQIKLEPFDVIIHSIQRRSQVDTDSHHLLVVPELYMN